MEKLRAFADSKENPLILCGPLFIGIALSFLWLFSIEIPPFLPLVGILALGLVWTGNNTAHWIAQGLLLAALLLSLWMSPLQFAWQGGLAFSLSLSLAATYLAQADNLSESIAQETAMQEVDVALAAVRAEVDRLRASLLDKEVFLTIARDELLHYQKLHREWSDAVYAERNRASHLEEQLQELVVDVLDSPEYRRLNGAYTQLKEQFRDKDKTLSETRRELFLSQEQTQALARELDEYKLYEVPAEISQLQRHCAEVEGRYSEEIARLEAEIKALEELKST